MVVHTADCKNIGSMIEQIVKEFQNSLPIGSYDGSISSELQNEPVGKFSTVKLSLRAAVPVNGLKFEADGKTVVFPSLLLRNITVELNVLPFYQDGEVKLFTTMENEPKRCNMVDQRS